MTRKINRTTYPGPIRPRALSAIPGGLATWQGHLDPLTGDRVLTAWTRPRPA
jgi:hypothetical protein